VVTVASSKEQGRIGVRSLFLDFQTDGLQGAGGSYTMNTSSRRRAPGS
jgi:hypothetical protein